MLEERFGQRPDPWTMALAGFDEAVAAVPRVRADYADMMRQPKRELTVNFPVRLDNGSVGMFCGFRVHHSVVRGPTTGGIRYVKHVTLEDVRALAMWTTWKCAIMGLPFGGAMGAVQVNPKGVSKRELENLTRRYTSEISVLISPEGDIPSPDMGTDAQVMAWMMDTFSMHRGYTTPAVVTGKPVEIGGTHGREEAAGRGLVHVMGLVAERSGLDLTTSRVAVQGYGETGRVAIDLLAKQGARIVAVADRGGGAHRGDGLDVVALGEWKDQTGSVTGFPGSEDISNFDLLTLDVDVVAPCAREGQITEAVAREFRARMLAEGANGPTTVEADTILRGKGVAVVPDILGSAGGVTASYFEWVQGLQFFFWTEDEINARLEQVMDRACSTVFAVAAERDISWRLAAMTVAIERVYDATLIRGIYP